GGMYRSDIGSFSYPAAFIGPVVGGHSGELFKHGFTTLVEATNSSWRVRFARPDVWSALDGPNVSMLAIGRWF
ncbi:hypothetical protein, partial [Phaeobacter sp. B1627]|uniref:hypothetical protein n=1 Tax=Phaeobacter sp. B1627 TaxID=2583809 RepID=UPI00159ECE89